MCDSEDSIEGKLEEQLTEVICSSSNLNTKWGGELDEDSED